MRGLLAAVAALVMSGVLAPMNSNCMAQQKAPQLEQARPSKTLPNKMLTLHTRSRLGQPSAAAPSDAVAPDAGVGTPADKPVEKTVVWDPRSTALIVVDMWDDHWCRGAARRVGELAVPMNKVLHKARDMGVFIIHSPSTCVDFYKDTPARKLALVAPAAKPKVPFSKQDRWGTKWCWPDASREPELPIDDSDMGCDCEQHCTIREAWTRENKLLDIEPGDAVSDDGQQVYNLLQERGIDNVLILGVHLNMCVLGRSFAIRELVHQGKNVLLVRDMTDTMYNHEMKPKVDHFTGTDLVIEHVEKYWCPTITSQDLVGGAAFRFAEDKRK